MPIKIFDICGTLYNSNTTLDFCEWIEKRPFNKMILKVFKSYPVKILNKLLMKIFHFDFIRALHIKSLKGMTLNEIESQVNFFVQRVLNQKKISEVHTLFKQIERTDVILVSATIEPIAKAVAHELNVKQYYATTLWYDKDKYCTGKIDRDILGQKHLLFKNEEIDLIVTDNKSDYKLCLKAKQVVIVSKKKNLAFWKSKNLNIHRVIEI